MNVRTFSRGGMLLALMILLAISLPAGRIRAQSSTITPPAELLTNVDAGVTDRYTFTASAGGIYSALVRGEGDFDPVLTLIDSAGNPLMTSDDYHFPNSRDALLEAFTIPRTGTYSLDVSGYDGAGGSYTLRLAPGFAQIAANETFDSSEGWEIADPLTATTADGAMDVSISGVRTLGSAFYQFVDPMNDGYVQAQFSDINNPSGWVVGLAVRQTESGYYSLLVNQDGLWRFVRVEGENITVVRDWTPHPNIVAGQTDFTLGLIANGSGFDFVYNGGSIGSATDATLTEAGSVGIVAGTTSSLTSTTTVHVDNFVVTTPTFIDGERVIPQQFVVTTPSDMQRALELRHLVPANGEVALTVPESSVEYARAGVNRLMLGRGTTYQSFAMGAQIDISAGTRSVDAGCGLVFRYTGETDYWVAYLTQLGEYGVSQRQGDTFLPGIYGTVPNFEAGRHHLLVVAGDTTLYYYIDGVYVGSLDAPAQSGEVGTAVVNFETTTTTCRYGDIWLWRWNSGS
ncbi:MAG: PPC domain-containing protein [Anaerolineae bacterium]